ncbi:sodium/substrate symporter small subunit [Parvibium lacunae]|uniref:DUF4212 domain-containing protein n=1 Tax=Parvibium lacunae TaxID=1888893 RepID=A0A368L530_9BURK|nr:sodium/substrate symporter small subunit [Parvibium lacunae]RCS58583.1 DUF4212 domain-containing protein [Parvibium lacunae]
MTPSPNVDLKIEVDARYRRRVLLLTLSLLLSWFILTFVFAWFAEPLAQWQIFGLSGSFFMAAQGILCLYLLLIIIYAAAMHYLDKQPDRPNTPSAD